jgi:hypothetical protein
MGTHIVAGKGAGKSRLLGRLLAWLDFVRGIPLVVIDPHGPLIDNFLDKLTCLPPADQRRLAQRIVYVDASANGGYVVPFPLYYRLGAESLFVQAHRFPEALRRLDPHLQSASIQGFNALWRVAIPAGMVASALGLQVTEAVDLVRNPAGWAPVLERLLRTNAEATPAAGFFLNEIDAKDQEARHQSFLGKTSVFELDPTMRAMFAASAPGLDWQEVVEERRAVLIDFRDEHVLERVRFKLLWFLTSFLEFVKQRGAGRHRPVSLVIDEITYLLSLDASGSDLLASDLDELVNRIARNYGVWLTLAHQEMYQVGERMAKTLLTMGTQIFGTTTDPEATIALAHRYRRFDPYALKRWEPVWGSSFGMPRVVDERPIEFTLEEQYALTSERLLDLERFSFLVAPAPTEGSVSRDLIRVRIDRLDEGQWVDEELVSELRTILSRRSGQPIECVLTAITKRLILAHATRDKLKLFYNSSTIDDDGSDNIPGRFDEEDEDEVLKDPKPTASS